MMVLSCIAAHTPYSFVGTCPEASFYLLQSEDSDTEQLVEEDNFCSALEYADSLGCDVVTASLGYYRFDYPEMNPTYADLDGKTSINSIAASIAASRGMLFLNSAGNEGDNTWKKIGFPGDAKDILTVGAVRADSVNTLFSSLGYGAGINGLSAKRTDRQSKWYVFLYADLVRCRYLFVAGASRQDACRDYKGRATCRKQLCNAQ